jgi:hypothetical protein
MVLAVRVYHERSFMGIIELKITWLAKQEAGVKSMMSYRIHLPLGSQHIYSIYDKRKVFIGTCIHSG